FGEPASYGFGWFVARYAGRTLLTHGGGIEGYSANLYHFPEEQLTIVVLANVKGRDDGVAPVDPLARRIADACLARDACRVDPEHARLRREISTANRAFSAAYLVGDTAAIRALYASEALALMGGARTVIGARPVARLFEPPTRNRRIAHALYTERLVDHGGAVVEVGTWFDQWQNLATGETGAATGRYTLTWVTDDGGRRRIAVDAWVPADDS
ncbi:MAG: serine hydrolase, partial [Gemmatimonadota bacterium]